MKDMVKALCGEYKDLQIKLYKQLHMHPELSFEENETSAFIKAFLAECGVPVMDGITGTSVVGILDGDQPGPTVGFRADIDALPVQECTGLPYASQIDGVMHACGHDCHCATLLCFAKLLSEHKDLVRGRVKFLFQAAEEKLPGGALAMVRDGAVDDCDVVYGFHSGGANNSGEITINIGPTSADIAVYQVKVHGKGGHGSSPHNALNPVPAACMAALAINQVLAEKASPLEQAVLTVAYFKNLGGNYPNIIDSEVVFGGNLRTFNHQLTVELLEKMEKLVKGICEAQGLTAEFNCEIGYHSNFNHEREALIARSAADELGYGWKTTPPGLGGEDFSYFMEKKPGAYFNIGMNDPKTNPDPAPHHNGLMKLDLNSLIIGLEMELGVYLKELEARG
ncbi:MAG: amidohydrolase [Firmicutes bacterium]|nr:amidohydrolase [Bacillota bacterium]MBR0114260.1 amidohydrolase [Bacillota bacterium]